jgi:hypothetical protein
VVPCAAGQICVGTITCTQPGCEAFNGFFCFQDGVAPSPNFKVCCDFLPPGFIPHRAGLPG